ncbi:MAG: GNAT family N-acetyltransferase [Anaerolineae bacterium]|nr:GNAT family N-acetyltransferase [Anaerolineae bacterium]
MAYEQKIADDLTLRTLRDEADRQAFAAFNARYNNPGEGATCDCLLHHHPGMTLEDFWVVEAAGSGEIVSTTCLIPWTVRFTGVELRVAQLEMVLTHPAYRGRGLVRAQMKNFERAVQARGFDLSIIWGIPFYYRQYGYAYTIEGETVEALPAWKIPSFAMGDAPVVHLRPAQAADIPTLAALYQRAYADQPLAAVRDAAYWHYLLDAAHHPIELLVNPQTGEPFGYVVLTGSGKTVTIRENSLCGAAESMALLQLLKNRGVEQVQIAWPGSLPLAALARQLGSQCVPGGQWLLRVPDLLAFLNQMRPVFEQRLAESAWAGLTYTLTINLFREAFAFCFEQGKLVRISASGFVDSSMGSDGGDLCIPPDAFLRLLSGYRMLDELFDAWPDITVKAHARPMIAALFPRTQPFFYTPYHNMSPRQDVVGNP